MLWRTRDPVRIRDVALPRHVVVLGVISLLTAASTAMIYGLLPVFLVRVMGLSMASVGLIEGLAEGATSVAKIASGLASDWIGRRKPLVLLGYGLSAVNKVLFPLATAAGVVLTARVIDRIGKGIRDAPRDAFLTDVTPAPVRGSGFGLRLAFYTVGFVLGPLAAMALMAASGDDFRLVFWIALLPAVVAMVIVLFGIKERRHVVSVGAPRMRLRPRELARFPRAFWWAVGVASVLSLARFSYAFLVLEAQHVGVDPAYVPIMLLVMHLVYAVAAYPFGVLADRTERRLQLGLGAVVLIGADLVLALADRFWVAAFGAALWGLQMAITQGLMSATVADAAPEALRGIAFGIYELAVGLATFLASAAAGALWMLAGPAATFGASGAVAAVLVLVLLLRPPPARLRAL
jgi:MFS family permease